jgi:hypothetical protein
MSTNPPSRFDGRLLLDAFGPDELRRARARKGLFRLERPFTYHSPRYGAIRVEPGLVSDFASVPAVAHWYVDKDSPVILYPSVVHDYLYARAGVLPGGRTFTRQECDFILAEAMIACGARRAQAWVVYWSVRAAGWLSWGRGNEKGTIV